MIPVHNEFDLINEDQTGGQMISFLSGLRSKPSEEQAYEKVKPLAGQKIKRNPAQSNKILRNAPIAGTFVNPSEKKEIQTLKEKVKECISSKKAHELEELEQKLKKSIAISEKELKQLCRLEKEVEGAFDEEKLKELKAKATELA